MPEGERRSDSWRALAIVVAILMAVFLGPSLVVDLLKPRGQAADAARTWIGTLGFRINDALEENPDATDDWRRDEVRSLLGPPGDNFSGEFREPVENPDGTVSYFLYVVTSFSTAGGWVGQTADALMCAEMVVDVRGEGVVHIENADCTDEVRGWTDSDVEARFDR